MSTRLTEEQKVIHFLNRTSFGPTREEVGKVNRLGVRAYLEEQLRPAEISDSLVEEKLAGLKTMRLSSRELIELYPPPRQQAGQQEMMGQQQMQGPRTVILELQQARLLRSVYSQRQLYEIMVDFWSNHFNVFSALAQSLVELPIVPLSRTSTKDYQICVSHRPTARLKSCPSPEGFCRVLNCFCVY